MTEEEFFGRQPTPVKVTFEGDERDIATYILKLAHAAEYAGAVTVQHSPNQFTIYPRAVND